MKTHPLEDLLALDVLKAALEVAHRRPKLEVLDGYLGGEGAQYVIRSAVDRGRYMCSKMFTSFPANLSGGKLPAVQAVCVLFDGSDGRPLAVIDGTAITHWRTAADSALGAKFLAAPEPRTLLVVGAGEMSRWLVLASSIRSRIELAGSPAGLFAQDRSVGERAQPIRFRPLAYCCQRRT